ncbi:type III secretion system chaperone family protein [Cohnella fermenti]|uniref:YbjN domain-containing protein n=1 Tax=Cohnella fermenti TaxID=2565925 RepID=A0A4S4BV70_9BACL|nr:hypothetical protein [Cohnella fermenti]THF76868.1 hypothetical protein E6C55_17540 [Cohnella fermenti]
MAIQHSTIKTSLPVRFLALDGSELRAVLNRIELRYDDAAPGDPIGSCELLLEVDEAARRAIAENEWFHLFRGVRLSEASFDPEHPARMTVSLRPALLRRLAAQGLDAEGVLDAFIPSNGAAPLSALLQQTESWLALELKQEVALPSELQDEGALSASLRTSWRDALGGEGGQLSPHSSDSAAASSLYDQMLHYLEAKGLTVEPVNDSLMRMRFYTEEAEWGSVIQVDEDARLLVLYSVFPTAIPAPLREETALAFIGENYGSLLGSYEMDTSDGELRYRTTVPADRELNVSLVAAALSDHLKVMKHFVPIVASVIEESGL